MAAMTHSRLPRVTRTAALAIALAALASSACALDEGRTEQGFTYVSGGVSLDEREALQAQRTQHSLWVMVAMAGSGAYTGDVHILIRDAAGRTVFDRDLDGPWLFIDLPRGRYSVEAVWAEGRQQRRTEIHAGDHHQIVFRLPANKQGQTIEANQPVARQANGPRVA
jgi:hypothetical protein